MTAVRPTRDFCPVKISSNEKFCRKKYRLHPKKGAECKVQDENLEIVYKFIKVLEIPITDLTEKVEQETLEEKKQRFFDFVKKHSFSLPEDYTFNREEIYER